MTTRRDFALGTYLESMSPWGLYVAGKAICADGQVRKLKRIAETADTFFSVPAAVTVNGKTVSGYVSVETIEGSSIHTDDDPTVLKFNAFTYGKNAGELPEGFYRVRYLETMEGIEQYLNRDGDLRVPCSRYGFSTFSCSPVAAVVALIVAGETGEPITEDGLDHIMGLVVNDHDDPEYLIRNYGGEYGFPPSRYLD